MLVKQISVFLENKSGRLAEVTKRLAEKNIDIITSIFFQSLPFILLLILLLS